MVIYSLPPTALKCSFVNKTKPRSSKLCDDATHDAYRQLLYKTKFHVFNVMEKYWKTQLLRSLKFLCFFAHAAARRFTT